MRKHHKISIASLVLISIVVLLAQLTLPIFTQKTKAASNTAYFTVGLTGNLQVGSIVTVTAYIELANNYNAASADIYYLSSRFQFVDATIGSKFNGSRDVSLGSSGNSTYVRVGGTRPTGGPINGASGLAAIRFRVLSSGPAFAYFGAMTVVLYPTTTYATSATHGSYTVPGGTNPTPSPTPPPTPSPTPPAPSPSPSPSPSPNPSSPRPSRPSQPTASAPSQSSPTPTGLQMTDFKITELDYRSALLTWKTNKPSTSWANYSTNKDDLSSEQRDDTLTTDHRLKLEGDGLRAGKHYFVRIYSDDGSSPATIDGEFDTKPIPVIITVTGEDEQPAEGVTVTVGETQNVTDANGEVTLNLPEGEVTIFAEKDDFSQQINATIDVPTDNNPQRISLSLTKTEIKELASATSKKKGTPIWVIVLVILFIIAAAIGGFFFWRRRRSSPKSSDTYLDPLEAENYTALPIPTTPTPEPGASDQLPVFGQNQQSDMPAPPPMPEPTYQELGNPTLPHHASLPELVGRYGNDTQQSAKDSGASPYSPAGQPIPQHDSLADMVHLPETYQPNGDQNPGVDDLPTSPVDSEPKPEHKPKHHSHKKSHLKNDDDGSLIIKH